MALLSGAFGVLALLLATVGVYGVVAYGVERRTKEIGIRLALGSTRPQVVRLLLHELVILLSMGLAIGGTATLLLGRSLQALLFGVTPYDPAMLSVSGASLTAVALFAGYLASFRAARFNPLDALRQG